METGSYITHEGLILLFANEQSVDLVARKF